MLINVNNISEKKRRSMYNLSLTKKISYVFIVMYVWIATIWKQFLRL